MSHKLAPFWKYQLLSIIFVIDLFILYIHFNGYFANVVSAYVSNLKRRVWNHAEHVARKELNLSKKDCGLQVWHPLISLQLHLCSFWICLWRIQRHKQNWHIRIQNFYRQMNMGLEISNIHIKNIFKRNYVFFCCWKESLFFLLLRLKSKLS